MYVRLLRWFVLFPFFRYVRFVFSYFFFAFLVFCSCAPVEQHLGFCLFFLSLFRSSLIAFLLPPSACLTLFFHLALPLHAVLDVVFAVLSIIWFLFRFLPSPLRPFPPALAPASSALLSL